MDARQRKVNALIGQSLISAEAIFSQVRDRIVDDVANGLETERTGEILELVRQVLERFGDVSVQAMTDVEAAGWLSGVIAVENRLPAAVRELLEGTQQPFALMDGPVIDFPAIRKAAGSLVRRNIVLKADFEAMERDARERAFTVARLDSEQVIERVRDLLFEQLESDTSLREFRKALSESLETSRLGPGHVETVFRTNIQKSFREGHDYLADNEFVRDAFPYQEYLPINDSRVRSEHAALAKLGLSGTGVYRRDDPFWGLWSPPNGFNCRCGINLLTIRQAARKGVREAQEWLRTGIEPPLQSRLPDIPFRPDPEFVT